MLFSIFLQKRLNILLDVETQLKSAASPRWLCFGQRQRYTFSDGESAG
jgi:hypothetical protein